MHKDLKDIIDEKKIAELATSPNAQEAFFGKNGLIKELVKNTLQTALNAELAHHLEQTNADSKNKRNGKTFKTMQVENGTFELEVPRDRQGDFDPQSDTKFFTISYA